MYDKDYFEFINQQEKSQADALAYTLTELFHPQSVLDLGCATGLYLKPFWDKGAEVFGIDFASAALDLAVIPLEYLSLQDITEPLSLPHSRWDMLLCIEVLEHIEEKYVDALVEKLCYLSELLVIIAAQPEQKDPLHINLQPKEYWIQKFAKHGLKLDDIMTKQVIARMQVIEDRMPWLDKNLMIFRKVTVREEAQSAPCRVLLSPKAISGLDRMVEDIAWIGVMDFSALSLVAMFMRLIKPQKVIELGTWIGHSTLVISDIIDGQVFTVDPNAEIQDRCKQYISSSNVIFLNGKSQDSEVVEYLASEAPHDVVLVDASHNYTETLQELNLYTGLIHDGGYIFLHDASEFAKRFDPKGEGGVRAALDEWLPNHPQYQCLILEPPAWPNSTGLAIITRRK